MAKLKANVRPAKSKKKTPRTFLGTCSNCGNKEVLVVKVLSVQMCVSECLIEASTRINAACQMVHQLGR